MEGRLADAAWELEVEERRRNGGNRAPAPIPRAKVEQLAKGFTDLMVLEDQKRSTVAKMIRACTARLRSPDSRKRAEAITALDELATMLEAPKK